MYCPDEGKLGAPYRAQLSRSGSIDGNTVSRDLDSETAPIIFDPVALLGSGRALTLPKSSHILWETTAGPLPMHPLIERREVLLVQRSY